MNKPVHKDIDVRPSNLNHMKKVALSSLLLSAVLFLALFVGITRTSYSDRLGYRIFLGILTVIAVIYTIASLSLLREWRRARSEYISKIQTRKNLHLI
jgi:uncharacterized membrane protein